MEVEDGTHFERCGSEGARIYRHDAVKLTFYEMAKEASVIGKLEPDGWLNCGSGIRPDILFIGLGDFYRDTMTDVSIIHPDSYPSLVLEKGKWAKQRETEKIRKFREFCQNDSYGFVPLVLETYGTVGKECVQFLKEICGKMPEMIYNWNARNQFQYWSQRVSVMLQTSCARTQMKLMAKSSVVNH